VTGPADSELVTRPTLASSGRSGLVLPEARSSRSHSRLRAAHITAYRRRRRRRRGRGRGGGGSAERGGAGRSGGRGRLGELRAGHRAHPGRWPFGAGIMVSCMRSCVRICVRNRVLRAWGSRPGPREEGRGRGASGKGGRRGKGHRPGLAMVRLCSIPWSHAVIPFPNTLIRMISVQYSLLAGSTIIQSRTFRFPCWQCSFRKARSRSFQPLRSPVFLYAFAGNAAPRSPTHPRRPACGRGLGFGMGGWDFSDFKRWVLTLGI